MRKILFSRIRLAMPGVTTSVSNAATRPPPIFGSSCWAQDADDRRCQAACESVPAGSSGNTSMMRLIVPAALEVCSVPNTMWPVSAAVMAASIVSRSRISPTRITSGSCRNARRIASANDVHIDAHFALIDRRLLVIVIELDRVFDRDDVVIDVLVDIVDHRGQRRALARAGRAGDQEQPARPHDQTLEHIGGTPSCSIVNILTGICRSTIATLPRCLKIETRNRAASPNAKPKSALPVS